MEWGDGKEEGSDGAGWDIGGGREKKLNGGERREGEGMQEEWKGKERGRDSKWGRKGTHKGSREEEGRCCMANERDGKKKTVDRG